MTSSNPWDIPPHPINGDADENATYASIGRALSQWEIFELHLSWLFRSIINVKGWPIPAERAYGSIATSRGRISMLQEAAKAFAFGYKADGIQKDIKKLLDRATNYSARRNEIAHGIVREYKHAVYHDGHGNGFVLAPPVYSTSKNERNYSAPSPTNAGISP